MLLKIYIGINPNGNALAALSGRNGITHIFEPMMKLVRPPWWMRAYYPGYTWFLPNDERVVYLTFDDGPTPEITEWVMAQLEQYQAKATFFLIGKNIEEQPEIFEKLKQSGHSLGNHTHNHLKGWKTSTEDYIRNFKKCDDLLETKLFRPPYGKLTKRQARTIRSTHRIIMWDILSYDFDRNVTAGQCFRHISKNVRPGSIIVFHDSVKAWPNLKEALPQTLEFLAKEGYRMEGLSE